MSSWQPIARPSRVQAGKNLLIKSTGGAGLGDSIRALLAGLHYAAVSGRRVAVAWDDGLYGARGVDVFPELLRLVAVDTAALPELDAQSVRPEPWRGALHLSLGELYARNREDDWNRGWALRHLSFDQRCFDYREQVLVMWDFDQFPASWAAAEPERRLGNSPEEALRSLAARHLRPGTRVLSEVRRVRSRFAPRMVGVHIRKTFEIGGETRHVALGEVFSVVDRLLRSGGAEGVFLATDNSEVEAAFLQRYPQTVTSGKRFGPPGVALHFDETVSDRTQGAVEALADLYLLAGCDFLVYPGSSSFSRVAAILGNIPNSCLFPLPAGRPWRRWATAWRAHRAAQTAPARAGTPLFLEP